MRRAIALLMCFIPLSLFAQANGKLQIHFIDVGQGDGALLISPAGETVLFDNGDFKACSKPVAYLDQLGVTKTNHHVASHYHSDHIGRIEDVFALFPLQGTAYDRGGVYDSKSYDKYVAAVDTKRRTATKGETFMLDAGTATPVTITFVGVDGNGIETENENDRSLVAKVNMGPLDAVIGGKLSGVETDDYLDIESGLAPDAGQVEVYKVHHHRSRYSSNETWLETIHPRVGIISAGTKNTYGHPTSECLDRLHDAGVETYWTTRGRGATPTGMETVVGTVIVEYTPNEHLHGDGHERRRADRVLRDQGVRRRARGDDMGVEQGELPEGLSRSVVSLGGEDQREEPTAGDDGAGGLAAAYRLSELNH